MGANCPEPLGCSAQKKHIETVGNSHSASHITKSEGVGVLHTSTHTHTYLVFNGYAIARAYIWATEAASPIQHECLRKLAPRALGGR